VRALLDRRGQRSIHPLLALLASTLWALAPSVLAEATRAGGALVAVALLLLVLRLLPEAFEAGEPRALVAAGLAAGGLVAECHGAAASVALVLLGAAFAWRGRPWTRHAGRLVAGLAFAFALLSSLRVGPASAAMLPPPEPGELWPAAQAGAGDALRRAGESFLRAWGELGVVPLALAGGGLALGLARGARLRRALAPWLLLGASGLVAAWLPSASAAVFGALMPSLALTALFPLALAQTVETLWGSRLPFGRHATVLTLTFASTLVLARADRALLARPPSAAVEAFTDAALGSLPPRSLLLVHTPPLVRRLVASRVLAGTRPDVVIVPASFITKGSLGRELARQEPSLAPLLRQLYVNGSADEYALSQLADDWCVEVELDRAWDPRLLEHLRPDGLWLEFSATALGPSERRSSARQVGVAARRIVELSGGEAALDRETRRALAGAFGGQALALATLERDEPARRLLAAARRFDRNSPLVHEARELLAGERGRVAASRGLE
jgi:hypothetical protein